VRAAGRKLSSSLSDLFPNLSYPGVAALDRADFVRAGETLYARMNGSAAIKGILTTQAFSHFIWLMSQPSMWHPSLLA